MKTYKIAISGFGGVGRATAGLLLSRRTRYREVYQADVRLVAACHLSRVNGAVSAQVGIRTYPLADPFADIRGKDKAIRIVTDAMGTMLAIGSGKEPLATAAAALKDLEHILVARTG